MEPFTLVMDSKGFAFGGGPGGNATGRVSGQSPERFSFTPNCLGIRGREAPPHAYGDTPDHDDGRTLLGIHQHDFGVFEPDDLDVRDIGDRRAVARLDAHAADLDRPGGRHQIGVPLRIQRQRDAARRP